MKLDVYNIQGSKTGRQVDLPDNLFGAETNDHAVYLAVKQYSAAQRQGTHKSKERSEITGSTRKIKRQKGTGTARMGSIKNPILRGGGRAFGPRPRDYSFRLNKKVKRLARISAFSSKASDGQIRIIEDFTFDSPKTREFSVILDNLELKGNNALFVTSEVDRVLMLSCRNLQHAKVMEARNLNTYEILKANTLVLAESAVEKIKETFA